MSPTFRLPVFAFALALALPVSAAWSAPAPVAAASAANTPAAARSTSTAPVANSSVPATASTPPYQYLSANRSPQVLERIVAVVNTGVILQSELTHQIALAQAQMRARNISPPSAQDLQGQVLQHMIMTRIQLQRAQKDGIKVDDSDINSALQRVAKQNHLSVAQLLGAAHKQGISTADLRENIRNTVVIHKVQRKEIAKHVDVTSQDVDLFLANQADKSGLQYHLSHILIAIPHDATKAQRKKAKAKADKILAQLKKGGDFAQLAIRNSDGQQALEGGDLGWRDADDIPTAFAGIVPDLKPGQFSDVIDSLNSYNIVKLDGKRTQGPRKKVQETHLRQIMLQPGTLRDATSTHQLAEKLYADIENGSDFKKLAQENSDDLKSKNDGGDLGWQPPGGLPPGVQKHADSLKPGQVSPPFQADSNWYIVKLLGRRNVDVTDKIRRTRARMAIMEQRAQDKYQSWLQRLRAQAYVDIRLKPGMITDAAVHASADNSHS